MDALGLTYTEVMDVIPYRNLQVMRRDKLRVCYGTKVVYGKVSGKDKLAQFEKKNGSGL